MEGRRQTALSGHQVIGDGLAAFPSGSKPKHFSRMPRRSARRTKLSLLWSRQYSFEKRFLNINPQSTPRIGRSGLFPKAYNAPFAHPNTGLASSKQKFRGSKFLEIPITQLIERSKRHATTTSSRFLQPHRGFGVHRLAESSERGLRIPKGPAMAQPISPPLKIRVETLPLARYLRCTRITRCP